MKTRILLAAIVFLAACSPQQPAAPARPANPKLAADLAAYEQMRSKQSWEIAATLGNDIVARAPASVEAAEVKKTLADVVAKSEAQRATKRLAALWVYQQGTESGGAQSTASIYSSEPGSEAERIELILRRHADWGTDAYFYGRKPGFECGKSCTVDVRFDDTTVKLKAHDPGTGDPALMFDDAKGFIERVAKAKTLGVDTALKPSKKPLTLRYEIGGFDPTRFAELPAKKK
jgi:hypothetical protein